jgi:hypothetical protein
VFDNDREQITIDQFVGQPNSLARVFDGFSPDPGITEPLDEVTVKFRADVRYSTS